MKPVTSCTILAKLREHRAEHITLWGRVVNKDQLTLTPEVCANGEQCVLKKRLEDFQQGKRKKISHESQHIWSCFAGRSSMLTLNNHSTMITINISQPTKKLKLNRRPTKLAGSPFTKQWDDCSEIIYLNRVSGSAGKSFILIAWFVSTKIGKVHMTR